MKTHANWHDFLNFLAMLISVNISCKNEGKLVSVGVSLKSFRNIKQRVVDLFSSKLACTGRQIIFLIAINEMLVMDFDGRQY